MTFGTFYSLCMCVCVCVTERKRCLAEFCSVFLGWGGNDTLGTVSLTCVAVMNQCCCLIFNMYVLFFLSVLGCRIVSVDATCSVFPLCLLWNFWFICQHFGQEYNFIWTTWNALINKSWSKVCSHCVYFIGDFFFYTVKDTVICISV